MRCPELKELPTPPKEKVGWPWTEASKRLPVEMSDSKPWPKISIVTPSYNQGQFIEETIRSVLLQSYPNLEYIIIDGASSDNSVEIIKKYQKWISWWVSEKDRGQSQALNKGLAKASGDIIAYLNSDDLYAFNLFEKVAYWFKSSAQNEWLAGACQLVNKEGVLIKTIYPKFINIVSLLSQPFLIGHKCQPSCPQPSVFLKANQIKNTGFFKEGLNLTMDHEYWIRLLSKGYKPKVVRSVYSAYRLHQNSKTVAENRQGVKTNRFFDEDLRLIHMYIKELSFWGKAKIKWRMHNCNSQKEAIAAYNELRGLSLRKKGFFLLKQFVSSPLIFFTRPWLGMIRKALSRGF